MSDTPDIDLTPETIEKVQTEARKSFSLKDRLNGIKVNTAKHLAFLDESAVDHYIGTKNKLQALATQLEMLQADPLKAESAMRKLEEHDAQLEVVEEAKKAMLESALSIHMVALPDVVVEAARRRAAKGAKQQDGTIDQLVFRKYFDINLVNNCVVKIVDPQGAEADFEPKTAGELLQGALGTVQWGQVVEKMSALLFNDSIGAVATDEPGF